MVARYLPSSGSAQDLPLKFKNHPFVQQRPKSYPSWHPPTLYPALSLDGKHLHRHLETYALAELETKQSNLKQEILDWCKKLADAVPRQLATFAFMGFGSEYKLQDETEQSLDSLGQINS